MATLFRSGDGEASDKIIIALEVPNDGWFKRNLIGALELMCREENWTAEGTATTDFARDKSNEMIEEIEIDVIIPFLPIGALQMWPNATIPAKWLLCNGQSLLRNTYPDLFAILGTVYGAVDGTHFTVPDFRDRSPMQPGTGTVTALAQMAGALAEGLTIAQLPAHAHDFADAGHVHAERLGNDLAAYKTAAGSGGFAVSGAANNTAARITTDSATSGITFHSQGGNALHANLHPVLGVNFIIYAGV